MKKIVESFTVLSHLGTLLLFYREVHDTYTINEEYLDTIRFSGHYANLSFPKAISGSLQNYAIIIACSFLDEYNSGFSPEKYPEYRDRLLKLRKITKPILRRINKWTNLKEYRNYILAHNYRVKGKAIFADDFQPIQFSIPYTNAEFVLFVELLRIIIPCIVKEFPEVVEGNHMTTTILDKIIFTNNVVNIEEELQVIWEQIKTEQT